MRIVFNLLLLLSAAAAAAQRLPERALDRAPILAASARPEHEMGGNR